MTITEKKKSKKSSDREDTGAWLPTNTGLTDRQAHKKKK